MLTKFKINLIAILMCVCLTSVGFSAWTITGTSPSVFISSSINVDQVIKSDEYVSVTKVNGFKFHKVGFVNENNEKSNTATLEIELQINMDNLYESFNATNITVHFNLGYSEEIPINCDILYICKSVTLTESSDIQTILYEWSKNATPTEFFHNFSSLPTSGTKTFTLTYEFDSSLNTDITFIQNFATTYPNYEQIPFIFDLKTTI